ncbi:hypothetical protein E2562_011905 [Oryza meyeriana var. granulata]|uniref:Uncharacterized protein n=1 Tax=Oryza meyeriana var. granulata TaxID=110450 RepID=A0A6G1CFC6_9ORYZ|nr:hypothetical protein E2562_011905 [Oryza meyeriana var. granulata]
MLPALRPLRRIPLARLRGRLFSCSASGEGGPPAVSPADAAVRAEELRKAAYKQVAELNWSSNADLHKAWHIMKNLPPKRKEFGLDFHLVQLFFVCLPSLAVYLVAQYARREIKRMEAEAEEKRKKDEELEKEKQLEADSLKHDTDSKLSAVLIRLDTLEGVVNEIVDDKKKGSDSNKEEDMKKGETLSLDRVSDSESNASDGQVVPVKSKAINGTTNASPNSTQRSPTGNGDKASSEPKG